MTVLRRHGLEDHANMSLLQCQENGGNEEMVNKMRGVEKVGFKGVSTLQSAKWRGFEQVLKFLRRVRKRKVHLVWSRVSYLCLLIVR